MSTKSSRGRRRRWLRRPGGAIESALATKRELAVSNVSEGRLARFQGRFGVALHIDDNVFDVGRRHEGILGSRDCLEVKLSALDC